MLLIRKIELTESELLGQLEHPEYFAEKVASLKPGSRRKLEVLAVRCVVKELFGGTEQVICYTEEGAPYLQQSPNQKGQKTDYISISHTQDYVAVAVSSVPTGIDIERRGNRVERVVSHFLKPEEVETIRQSGADYELGLHLAWSAKESAYKVLGKAYYDLQQLTSVTHIDWENRLLTLKIEGRDCPMEIAFGYTDDYVWTQCFDTEHR